MKKILQLFLLIILISISYFSYQNYFKTDDDTVIKNSNEDKEGISEDEKGNFIKNLKYEVKFDNNTEYTLSASKSEITYEGETETVLMKEVNAFFIDKNGLPLIIESEKAIYNNSNYNTNFTNNVVIKYMGNTIRSSNLDLNFSENIVTIYNNVVYDGIKGLLKADNIKINIETRDIEIFMNNSKDKVEITSK
jgi:lipopolysaccharide export system protein LptA